MNGNDKILKRIKNLLAMSRDTSSPHEAMIAAKRVRSLMDKAQITELDLTTAEDLMGTTDFNLGTKNYVTWVGVLSAACAVYNDCRATYLPIAGKKVIRYEGLLADSVCATMLLDYLRDECNRQAQREEGRADRNAFRLGFAFGVSKQVKEFMEERQKLKTSTGTSLVVCKTAMVEKRFGAIKWSKNRSKFSGGRDSFKAGKYAGENASLNRQANGASQGRLAG